MLPPEHAKQLLNSMIEKIKELNDHEIATRTYCNKLFVMKDGTGIGIPLNFEGHEQKEMMFDLTNELLKKLKPDMAIHASEAWIVTRKENKDFDMENLPLPSESPDRKECYIIYACTHGYSRTIILPFVRLADDSIQFEKEINYDSDSGNTKYNKLFEGVFTDDMQTIGGLQ